jgi:small subunit ribosomal protein S20
MANIKSQVKRIKTNEKARLANASFKSSMRTAIKAVQAAVKAGNKESAIELMNVAFSRIDKSVSRGIQHKNAAARQKAALAKLVNSL